MNLLAKISLVVGSPRICLPTITVLVLVIDVIFLCGSSIVAWAAGPAGMLPLYSYFNPTTGHHFYTADINEGNNALASSRYVTSFGYIAEGITGYISSTTMGSNPFI
jgi:hypothetical protein